MTQTLPRMIVAEPFTLNGGRGAQPMGYLITAEPRIEPIHSPETRQRATLEYLDHTGTPQSVTVWLDSILETYDPATQVALTDVDLDVSVWVHDTEDQHDHEPENILPVRAAQARANMPTWVRPEVVLDRNGLKWIHDDAMTYVSNRDDDQPDVFLRLDQIKVLHGPITVVEA